MHIADGIIPAGISVGADAAAVALVYVGGRNLRSEEIPKMGIFAAALFIVSLIHFPIAGTSIHLGLYGLAGLLFGIRAIPIIFVNLLFQCLIFQHGGLLSMGINTLTMGSGAFAAWVVWKSLKLNNQVKSFACGFLGILIPAILVSVIFVLVNYGKGMVFIVTIYLPAAVIEGFLTVFAYNYFYNVKPEILK
ncbi:MAG: cobalamin biosynthesis protein CbiM [Candidatus Aminicenantes bacterium]|nr:cobalamin biosynthesis protein CbiM [Candidatus Aminicenantes bacterium]NIM78428.1 cobalamin biosynthesis protein CbiM [Candidatus Aminicenantes bacterium]NIN17690.1 cobalamin biosynthesis protein CbiM [Candidatus Aminicenantes bacterium]NIN41566.1 cobalamin biosynthesis protein CbiM [Candidatus Aminicenantes bacterium]NIN84340.1 cobalamin biosynthesis protein CbiM [Candidatus Aminicenantes bacterium]